jgi:hypothetical protein
MYKVVMNMRTLVLIYVLNWHRKLEQNKQRFVKHWMKSIEYLDNL